MKELIEQIGGRDVLINIAELSAYGNRQKALMARALLAVLDAQEKPFMYAISDCDGEAYFDEICVDSDGGLLSDVVDSLNDSSEKVDIGYSVVPLYTIPPAASVPDGWKLVPLEPNWSMIDAAIKHHEGEAFLPVSLYKAMVEASPAPGDKK